MPAEPTISARHRLGTATVLAAAALLAGCSGGSSGNAGATPAQTVTVTASQPPSTTAAAPASPAAAGDGTVTDVNADLKVEDQGGGGQRVRVDEVQISNGTGFVAVFSARGALLGSVKVSPTVRRPVVPLSKRVPATSELLALLYADNGDGQFTRATDPRVVDDEGKFVDDTFDYTLR